jgi:hypothetical protein
VTANQQVRFDGEPKGEKKTVSADVHVDGSGAFRFDGEDKHATTRD